MKLIIQIVVGMVVCILSATIVRLFNGTEYWAGYFSGLFGLASIMIAGEIYDRRREL